MRKCIGLLLTGVAYSTISRAEPLSPVNTARDVSLASAALEKLIVGLVLR